MNKMLSLSITCFFSHFTLRVDHERPSARVGDNDAVVNGERVNWQSSNVPRSYLDRVTEDGVDREDLEREGRDRNKGREDRGGYLRE